MRKRAFLGTVSAFLFSGCVGIISRYQTQGKRASETSYRSLDYISVTEEEVNKTQIAEVGTGQIIYGDGLALQVERPERSSENKHRTSDSRSEFVTMTIRIKNTSNQGPVFVNDILEVGLLDNTASPYAQSDPILTGELASEHIIPGEVKKGEITFSLPKDSQVNTLVITFDSLETFSFERVYIDLENEAEHQAELKSEPTCSC